MTEKTYFNIEKFFKNNPFYYNSLKVSYKVLPAVIFVSYALLIIIAPFIFGFTNIRYIKIVMVPLCIFLIVSVFRKLFNFQRPYERMNITPLVYKNKKGHSFPSRHVASGFIISMAFMYIYIPFGIIFAIISTLIALTRVLSGVHFIKDVIAGALFSVVTGIIFLFLI